MHFLICSIVLATELEEHDGEPQTDTPTAAAYHGRSRTVCCGHSGGWRQSYWQYNAAPTSASATRSK